MTRPPGPGGSSLTITAYRDNSAFAATVPGLPIGLNNSWGSPAVPLQTGHVNSCMNINPASGYTALCRVVNGYDKGNFDGSSGSGALYDHTDWDVKIIAGHPAKKINDPGYGLSISTYVSPTCQGSCSPLGVNMFEGCHQHASWDGIWPIHSAATSTDEYFCDYAVYDQAFIKPTNHTDWQGQVVSQLWPQFRGSFSDYVCAVGVMSLTGGVAAPVVAWSAAVGGCALSTLDALH